MKKNKIQNLSLLIFIILLSSTFQSNSQIVFNRIDSLYDGPTMRNIVVQDTIYVSVGGSSIDGILGVVTRKNTLNGDTVKTQYFADTCEWGHGVENSLKETKTSNYILGGNRAKNYFRDNLLIKFDNNFDTIFTKKYYPVDDNGNSDVITYNSNIDVDSNYLLVGITNIDNNYNILPEYQMQLIKTDTLGDLLWRKVYGNSSFRHYGYKVVPAFDGGYLLGGWADTNGGDWALVKTDENGENPIFKYFGHPTYSDGKVMEITRTSDTCYIICGNYAINGTTDRARILKLDSNLNIVWDKQYLNYASISFFFEAIEKNNGNIVVYGANKNSLGMTVSELMELTNEGDYIWQQTIAYDAINATYNYAYNAKITPDGGLIMTGKLNSVLNTPYQQMWLVKTDSMGYDGTVSVPELTSNTAQNNLILYPNPTKNILHISINRHYEQGTSEVIPIKKQITSSNLFPGNNLTIEQFNHLTIEQFNNLTIEQFNNLTIEQFSHLTIEKKLKYSSKNPNNKFWGKKEEQEMRELSHKLAYAFPFEVIKGKVDIFSIDPALKANLIVRNEEQITKQSVDKDNEVFPTKNTNLKNAKYLTKTEVKIYDIFGHCVIASYSEVISTNNNQITIDVSNLQKGIYIVRIGEYSAKFIKE